jgi:hypothetical protein
MSEPTETVGVALSQQTPAVLGYVNGTTDWWNVLSEGADPTGLSDSTTAIQTCLNAAAPNCGVFLPGGTYRVSFPLIIPAGVKLFSTHGRWYHGLSGGAVIKPSGLFSGSQILQIAGSDAEIGHLTVDCSNLSPAAAIDGIDGIGPVTNVYLHDLLIRNAPQYGFQAVFSGGNPFTWNMRKVIVDGTGSKAGFNVSNMTDVMFEDCYAIGCAAQGWYLYGMGNSVLSHCRAEWNAGFGYQIDGSGGMGLRLIGCSTDRNTQHGIWISSTSNEPIVISGHIAHRDGAGSTSAGYAGIAIASTCTNPVLINGLAVYPGVNDDGSGNDSPQYGLSVGATPTYVSVANALLHGVSAGLNGSITNGREVATRTGAIGTPSAITMVADTA